MHVTVQLFTCYGENCLLVKSLLDQERTLSSDVIITNFTIGFIFLCFFLWMDILPYSLLCGFLCRAQFPD